MRRMLSVVPAVVLLAACGAPEALPVVPAAAVSPATASRTGAPTTQPLGVVPVDMGPAVAQETAARAAAQAGNPPGAPARGKAPEPVPADQPAPAPGSRPVAQPAPRPAPQPVAQPASRPGPQPASQPVTRPAPEPAPKPAASGPAGGCNANYSPCVPSDSDVDCQGGSGNGPSSVRGPVQVVGTDVYGLDADDDGVGCA